MERKQTVRANFRIDEALWREFLNVVGQAYGTRGEVLSRLIAGFLEGKKKQEQGHE